MAKKSPAPQLFDVLPAGQMRQALADSLPAGHQAVWEHVGSLRVTHGKLAVLDAGSLHPRYLDSESQFLDWPYPRAELAVRFAADSDGRRSRVLAVLVTAPANVLPKKMPTLNCELTEASMSIDSATAAVCDYGRLLTECQAGGPLATVLVGRGDAKTAQQKQQRQKAQALLKKLGLPVADDASDGGTSPVRFATGLSDEQIEQARAALAAEKNTEEIWVPISHTDGQVGHDLSTKLVAWYPAESEPCLLAFHTGFGDGGYDWQAINANGILCGYLCDFLPTDEGENGEDEEHEPEQADEAEVVVLESATNDAPLVFPAHLAPALEPGINVAARTGGLMKNWFLAELVGKVEAGYSVRLRSEFANPDRETEVVGPRHVVPMPNRQVFQVGDLVSAHCSDGSLQPAIVRAISPQKCEVEVYASKPLVAVPIGELTFAEWLVLALRDNAAPASPPTERKSAEPPLPAEAAPPFGPGVAVAVRLSKKMCHIARIIKAASGGFEVKYLSGDQAKVKEAKLIAIPDQPVFRTGDAVIAVWSHAAMYQGRITGLSPAGYAVTWDDGPAPQIVPLGSLTFASWGA